MTHVIISKVNHMKYYNVVLEIMTLKQHDSEDYFLSYDMAGVMVRVARKSTSKSF